MGKVSPIDEVIANNLRELRTQAKLTQPQVAGHLGIAYQSYQKMEGGRVSFRASTLVRLAQLYGTTLDGLVEGSPGSIDRMYSTIQILLLGMSEKQREDMYRAGVQIKHGA
jgi:transcriptional regulator with XRE-family HTH domain